MKNNHIDPEKLDLQEVHEHPEIIMETYDQSKSHVKPWQPVLYILLSLLFTVGQSSAMHYAATKIPFMENLFITNIIIFIVTASITMLTHQGRLFLPVVSKFKVFMRCLIGFLCLVFSILSLKYFELFVNQAFSLVPNVIVALIGLVIYKEQLSKLSKIGLFIGCSGIVYLFFDSFNHINEENMIYLSYPIAMVAAFVAIFLYIKDILKTDSVNVLTIYYAIGLLVAAFFIYFFIDEWVSIMQFDLILSFLITGVSGTLTQWYRNKALETGTLTLFAALNPLTLVFTLLAGYYCFDEMPVISLIIASSIIVLGSYIVVKGQE